MGEKIARENRKFKFETLQLHVGQETPDPVTDARAGSDLSDVILCVPQ